jgi:hypothetical protein
VIGVSERVKEGSSDLQGNKNNEKESCDTRKRELRREVITSRGMRIIIKRHVIGESERVEEK